jgi:hypothetical protein
METTHSKVPVRVVMKASLHHGSGTLVAVTVRFALMVSVRLAATPALTQSPPHWTCMGWFCVLCALSVTVAPVA